MKINVVNVVKMKALVKNIKRERPDLVASFSEHALTETAKNEIIEDSSFASNINYLTAKCIASMENQLKTTHKEQKKLLQDCLECDCDCDCDCDCEYPLEVIAKMTPRQKINNYLIWNGIEGFEGFTDDILDAVSAAYGIILEPDLNR